MALSISTPARLGVDFTTQIGVNGVGIVNQDSGTFTTGFLDLSITAGSGSSAYNMAGGALNVGANLGIAGSGTGTAVFNQSGTANGGSTVTVGDTLFVNKNGSNPGQYNISGPSSGPNTVSLTVG